MASGAVTLAFVGHADAGCSEQATAYEDRVLELLAEHGARVLFRGRRAAGEDASLPLEVQVLWFPDRRALDAYLADPRRLALLEQFGEVFTSKQAVELGTISGDWVEPFEPTT
jgi:uncharacterized protein (DUF1330 family)